MSVIVLLVPPGDAKVYTNDPLEMRVTASFTRLEEGCGASPGSTHVFEVRMSNGILHLTSKADDSVVRGEIEADGSFRAASRNENYAGTMSDIGAGSAQYIFRGEDGCVTTADVTFTPIPFGFVVDTIHVRGQFMNGCPAAHENEFGNYEAHIVAGILTLAREGEATGWVGPIEPNGRFSLRQDGVALNGTISRYGNGTGYIERGSTCEGPGFPRVDHVYLDCRERACGYVARSIPCGAKPDPGWQPENAGDRKSVV